MTVYNGFRAPDVFLRLGLRTNPFCQLEPTELAELIDPPLWLNELAVAPWDVLVLQGESGLGKTSAAYMLMRALEPEPKNVAYFRTDEKRPRLPKPPQSARLVVLDSVQRLPQALRRKLPRWLERTPRAILVGQEDALRGIDLDRALRRVVPPAPSLEELHAWYRRRVERVVLPGRAFPALDEAFAQALLKTARGNRMRLQEALYDHFETAAM